MDSFISLPSPALAPYVSHYCYANYTSRRIKEQGSFPYGGTVLSINLCNETQCFEMNKVIYNLKSNLAGILEKATYIEQIKNHVFFLVFFTPLGTYKLLGIPQIEFSNNFIDLGDVYKDGSQFQEQLALAQSPKQITDIANSFFMKYIGKISNFILYDYAIKKMVQSYGTIRINNLCNHLNISQRSFERNFKNMVGVTPKSYNRILRLQQVYNKILCNGNLLNLHDLIYKLGYFDQAHFIHDLKKYTNRTPGLLKDVEYDLFDVYFKVR